MALNQTEFETLATQIKEEDAAYFKWLEALKDSEGIWREGFRTLVLTELAGVSFRQVDYWARRGVLAPEIQGAEGSGSQRVYSFEDVCLGALAGRLVSTAQEGWGLTLEKAGQVLKRVRKSGGEVCTAAGVIAPSPNYKGPLLFEEEAPKGLVEHGFVVIGRPDVRALASRAVGRTVAVSPVL